MNNLNADEQQLLSTLQEDESNLENLVKMLESSSRLERHKASCVLHAYCEENSEQVADYIPDIVKGLKAKEAQTRWELLEVLALVVEECPTPCNKAINDAEACLFDEDNGMVRLAAMKFLCRYGATSRSRSDKTWPLIDEGIQCYHGDAEFGDMLNAIILFSQGKISDNVKNELAHRMRFDAEMNKGMIKRKAALIIENTGIEFSEDDTQVTDEEQPDKQ